MNEICKLLIDGLTYSEINKITGKSKSTISYWSSKLQLGKKPGPRNVSNRKRDNDGRFIDDNAELLPPRVFPWKEINEKYKSGVSKNELINEYKIYNKAWYQALKNGDITRKAIVINKLTLQNIPAKLPHKRDSLKKILLQLGVPNECKICGQLPEWAGKPLCLQLDHIDGNTHNDVIDNLRLLCPNCHTQTDSFSGRNIKKRKFEN